MAAIRTSNWWMVKGLNFNNTDGSAKSLVMKVKGKGTIDVTTTSTTSLVNDPVATVEFDTDVEKTITVPLNREMSGLVSYLYFIVRKSQNAEVISWQFTTEGSVNGDVNGDGVVDTQDVLDIYEYMKGQTQQESSTSYDVNGDGVVDTQDVLKVYDCIRGK